jgi:hypothetical protein
LAEQQDSVAVVRDALREMSAGRRIDDADGAVADALATLDSRLADYAGNGAKGLPVMFSHQAFALRAALEANRTWGSHRPHG